MSKSKSDLRAFVDGITVPPGWSQPWPLTATVDQIAITLSSQFRGDCSDIHHGMVCAGLAAREAWREGTPPWRGLAVPPRPGGAFAGLTDVILYGLTFIVPHVAAASQIDALIGDAFDRAHGITAPERFAELTILLGLIERAYPLHDKDRDASAALIGDVIVSSINIISRRIHDMCPGVESNGVELLIRRMMQIKHCSNCENTTNWRSE
jgi:hypothetical protein